MTNRRFSLTIGIQVFLFFLAFCGKTAVAEQSAQSLKGEKKNTVATTASFSTELQAFLDEIQKKDKWKTADVMELVPRLQLFRKELEQFQHLPNLEAMKEKFPAKDHTVQVLDLHYRYAIHRSFQAVSKEIEKIDGWNNDARLVVLALECVVHLDSDNFARQLELGRRLVELEPENMKFKQAIAWIEKQLGKSRPTVQPRQKRVPGQGQQAQ